MTEQASARPLVSDVVLHGDDGINRHDEIRSHAFRRLNPEFGKLVVRRSEFARHCDQMTARTVADCADFAFVDVEFACMLADIDDCHLNVFELVGIVVAVVGDTVAQNESGESVRGKPPSCSKALMRKPKMMIAPAWADYDGGSRRLMLHRMWS